MLSFGVFVVAIICNLFTFSSHVTLVPSFRELPKHVIPNLSDYHYAGVNTTDYLKLLTVIILLTTVQPPEIDRPWGHL